MIRKIKSTDLLLFLDETPKNTKKYSGAFKTDFGTVYIKEVIYNNPATIVLWSDKTKTVTKCCPEDSYSRETGLSICILKKLLGASQVHQLFSAWVEEDTIKVTLHDVIKKTGK